MQPSAQGLLARPGFLLRLGTSFLCNVGTWTHSLGVSFLVLQISHSVLAMGVVAFAGQIPNLLLTPIAGALAERHDPRRMVLLTETFELLASVLLVWVVWRDHPSAVAVAVAALMKGIATAFRMPAQTLLLYQLVEPARVPDAIVAQTVQFNVARVVGPLLAALLVKQSGHAANFLFTAAAYVVSIGVLAVLPGVRARPARRRRHVWLELISVGRYARRHASAAGILALVGVSAMLGQPIITLSPYFSRELPGSGQDGFGSLVSFLGAGALISSTWILLRPGLRTFPLLLAAVAVSVLGFLLISVAWSWWVVCAAMFLMGMSNTFTYLISSSLLLTGAPPRLRGRITVLHLLVTVGSIPLGGLFVGAIAQPLGARATTAFCAALLLTTLVVVMGQRRLAGPAAGTLPAL